ncbi:unnamed protein product [Acanthoscelides obtectus]|uniref:Uncharacterized protein n=1 Tax=Acanthoscelides obtectus TaxID=200917 RepID=A0A9P0M5R5_ACAOB|nr:unnamed protein product [Acanthoscelides obtectus]CAK1644601.1 hypothetical protein AOBTE_LOCUS13890 [Acanthoscelides obtectus]
MLNFKLHQEATTNPTRSNPSDPDVSGDQCPKVYAETPPKRGNNEALIRIIVDCRETGHHRTFSRMLRARGADRSSKSMRV